MRSGTVDGLNANAGVNQRCVTVELLTGETILISIEGKTTCSAIWNRVEGELVARGVVHPQIFGLAVKTGSDWVFVDLDEKLSKYFPKEGKSTSASSSSSTSSSHHHHHNQQQHSSGSITERSKPALVLYVRVHFYLETLPQAFDVVTLLHYYLQLRQNLIAAPRCPVANLVQAVAYALQSELGDWRPCQEMPRWAHSLKATLGPSLTRSHQAVAGLQQQAARLAFIRSVMPQYNMHLFGMTLKTKEGKDAPAWIGVTPKGIEIYQHSSGAYEIPDQPRFTFLWANITKLYFERKKFEIRGVPCPWLGSNQKLSFTASSELVPRHLLLLCRSTHQFPLTNGKLLLSSDQQQQPHHNNHHHSNGNGHKASSLSSTGGESSCNSTLSSTKHDDNKMLDLSLWADGLLLTGESGEHQRVSVISNASSNTTSGIVSDRVYSLDGSEEDLEIREVSSDICTDRAHRRNNSTSLESLSHNHHRHPPAPTKPRRPAANHTSGGSNSTALTSTNGHHDGDHHCDDEDGSEAKYWYCDSDCEQDYEQTETTPPCRSSLLVRTIGEKRGCAGHCECNCCTAEEDEVDGVLVDGESSLVHKHHNTPSMVSETTLKAVDISSEQGMELESSPNQQNGGSKDQEKVCTEDAEEYKLEDEHVYGEISDELEVVKTNNKKCSNKHDCRNNKNNCCERQYCVLEEESKCCDKNRSESGGSDSDCNNKKAPKPKPRYSCVKMVDPQKRSCKCMPKERCCIVSRKVGPAGGICKHKTEKILCNNGTLPGSNGVSSSACGKECRRSYSTNVVSPTKENGFTPKIASLKCLRSPKHGKSTCCSNMNGEDKKKNGACNMKSRRVIPTNPPSQMNNYVEFGGKLQQGQYPGTRTVSDNFDTDSDYVRLPPLMPPPLPKKPNSNKLWKLVGNPTRACKNPTSSSPTPPQVNMSTLPRRKPAEASIISQGSGQVHCVRSNLLPSKPSSRSTTALNLLSEGKRPEPPPKPRKSMADLTAADTTPIDARIISTKPQIQIQTAYASPAPIAIPATSKVLYRPPRLPLHHLTHHLNPGMLQHSKSVDNIYDTVAAEEPFIPTIPAPPYPSKSNASVIIHPNNYIDVHASSRSKLAHSQHHSQSTQLPLSIPVKANMMQQQQYLGAGLVGGIGGKCGSVPNNLNNFLIGLQNLKPLSRAPIVHPAATSCMSLSHSTMVPAGVNVNGMIPGSKQGYEHNYRQHSCVGSLSVPGTPGMSLVSSNHPITTSSASIAGNPRFTTVYTNQLTRSQIQQFKAQLYSDLDYVIFPPKDPRVSQQEYFDSKGLGYTTITNSNPMLGGGIACAYSMSDIPPPYLPPPPPYAPFASSGNLSKASMSVANGPPPPLPGRRPKVAATTASSTTTTPSTAALGKPVPPVNVIPSTGTTSLSNQSLAATLNTSSLYHHNSYQSLYNVGSPASHCSSSQYGYYGGGGVSGLNAENLQKFLSTQSFAGSNSSAAIYYPSSTQSAPPLPPYKNNGNVVVENGMRKAVQQLMASSRTAAGSGGGMMMTPASSATSALTSVDDRIRMKLLCRSEESLYAQPTNETEERLQAIYNLPPPPPYKRVANRTSASHGQIQRPSPSEIDLASLRAKCKALDLPLLKALCSDGELMAKKPGAGLRSRIRPTAHAHPNPKLPPKQPTLPAKTTKPAPPPPPTCTVSSQKTANTVKA